LPDWTKINDADFNAALGVALKSLAAFEKFPGEITRLLEKKGYDEPLRTRVLEHLARKKLVDGRRCAELAVRRLIEKGAGREKILRTLEARGASLEVAEEALANLEPSPERIQDVLRKKFPSGASKEKAARFLYSRGFSDEEIEAAIEGFAWQIDAERRFELRRNEH
jgi:SOS response regulatory protein OraA/RecX